MGFASALPIPHAPRMDELQHEGTTPTMKKTKSAGDDSKRRGCAPARLIDARIKELADWRGAALARVRVSHQRRPCPDVVEEWKWRGVPVWEYDGIICTGETYKGCREAHLRSRSLDPKTRSNPVQFQPRRQLRGVRFTSAKARTINEPAFTQLIRAAVAANSAARAQRAAKKKWPGSDGPPR